MRDPFGCPRPQNGPDVRVARKPYVFRLRFYIQLTRIYTRKVEKVYCIGRAPLPYPRIIRKGRSALFPLFQNLSFCTFTYVIQPLFVQTDRFWNLFSLGSDQILAAFWNTETLQQIFQISRFIESLEKDAHDRNAESG